MYKVNVYHSGYSSKEHEAHKFPRSCKVHSVIRQSGCTIYTISNIHDIPLFHLKQKHNVDVFVYAL